MLNDVQCLATSVSVLLSVQFNGHTVSFRITGTLWERWNMQKRLCEIIHFAEIYLPVRTGRAGVFSESSYVFI